MLTADFFLSCLSLHLDLNLSLNLFLLSNNPSAHKPEWVGCEERGDRKDPENIPTGCDHSALGKCSADIHQVIEGGEKGYFPYNTGQGIEREKDSREEKHGCYKQSIEIVK